MIIPKGQHDGGVGIKEVRVVAYARLGKMIQQYAGQQGSIVACGSATRSRELTTVGLLVPLKQFTVPMSLEWLPVWQVSRDTVEVPKDNAWHLGITRARPNQSQQVVIEGSGVDVVGRHAIHHQESDLKNPEPDPYFLKSL